MQKKSINYYNLKRKIALQLKKKDKVYLLIKNLKRKKGKNQYTKKLDYVKVGPFFIKKQKGPVNCKIDLLEGSKIYPVFYISLLEPTN